jgi:integrase
VEFLKWKHVNFRAEEVTITTYKDKNMKQWQISVSSRLKAELLKLKLQRTNDDPNERLFASASVNLRKVWEAARKEAGITNVRFHDLRHTFATRMADAGMEMQELAKILGHTDISMTYRYYHLTKEVNNKMRGHTQQTGSQVGQMANSEFESSMLGRDEMQLVEVGHDKLLRFSISTK